MATFSNVDFYSKFFQKSGFLSYDDASVYVQPSALEGVGFKATLDWTGKHVLELGAGAGRLTVTLHKLGLVEKAASYTIVEPSSGLSLVEQYLSAQSLGNVRYVNDVFENLHRHIDACSVDYFIASGVIPHIETPDLVDLICRIGHFVADQGVLHVSSSYHGFDKRLSQAIRRAVHRMPAGFVTATAAVTTMLQKVCFMGTPAMKSFFIKNFVYSPHRKIKYIFSHMREFCSIDPYNINWGYSDYFSALRANDFGVVKVFPSSVALLAQKGSNHKVGFTPADTAADIVILGDDWLARTVSNVLTSQQTLKRVHVVSISSPIPDGAVVVLAYDFTSGPPYQQTVSEFERRGWQFGRDLFLFQMLI